jgi:hypothetical protein
MNNIAPKTINNNKKKKHHYMHAMHPLPQINSIPFVFHRDQTPMTPRKKRSRLSLLIRLIRRRAASVFHASIIPFVS